MFPPLLHSSVLNNLYLENQKRVIMFKKFHHPTMLCLLAGLFFISPMSSTSSHANEFEVRGNIEIQGRFFYEEPLFQTQHDNQLSLAAAPEFFWSWNEGNDSFEFVPSARVDQYDDNRTHMRETRFLGGHRVSTFSGYY
jgi:hypothetical protein